MLKWNDWFFIFSYLHKNLFMSICRISEENTPDSEEGAGQLASLG